MSDKTQAELIATWTVKLHCECPKCERFVNLLNAPDFWDGRKLDILETGTELSNNLDVACPECGHQFNVKCEY